MNRSWFPQQVPHLLVKYDPYLHLSFSFTYRGQTTDQRTKRPRGIDFSIGDLGRLFGRYSRRRGKKSERAWVETQTLPRPISNTTSGNLKEKVMGTRLFLISPKASTDEGILNSITFRSNKYELLTIKRNSL